MKNKIIYVLIFITASVFTLTSCKKDKATVTPTTLATLQSDPSISIFSAIESRSGDDDFINNSSAIIIPVDSAFISAGITAAVASSLSTADCDSIVRYYTIPTGVNLNGTASTEVALTSVLGPALFADSTGTVLYINGVATVSNTPVVIGKTSVYKLTQVLNLPVNNILQLTAADNNLSLFNEALIRTNLAQSISSGSFTVLMPTNSAFISAGYPDITSIDTADVNALTQILLYHVIANNLFDNDLAQRTTLTTLQGNNIVLNNTNGILQLVGNSDPSSPATLLSNGVLAGNILAYKISSLLLP